MKVFQCTNMLSGRFQPFIRLSVIVCFFGEKFQFCQWLRLSFSKIKVKVMLFMSFAKEFTNANGDNNENNTINCCLVRIKP